MPCDDCSRADICPPCVNEDTPRKEGAGESGGHVHKWGEWDYIGLNRTEVWIRRCPCGASQSRLEAPQEPVCGHCEGPHALEDCQGLEEPEEGAQALPAPAPRPPYAVAYSVAGTLREVFLPGDASAVAEDGVLTIRHDGPVLAIVRVAPVKESD